MNVSSDGANLVNHFILYIDRIGYPPGVYLYVQIRLSPGIRKKLINKMAATCDWSDECTYSMLCCTLYINTNANSDALYKHSLHSSVWPGCLLASNWLFTIYTHSTRLLFDWPVWHDRTSQQASLTRFASSWSVRAFATGVCRVFLFAKCCSLFFSCVFPLAGFLLQFFSLGGSLDRSPLCLATTHLKRIY